MRRLAPIVLLIALVLSTGCDGNTSEGGVGAGRPGGGQGGRGGPPGGRGGPAGMPGMDGGAEAAVPVEVTPVVRRSIASYIETNGTLEAENEVDVVARTSGPIVELLVEEGDRVEKGQLLARLDDVEPRAQLEIARVTLNETELAFERAKKLRREELISHEEYEQAQSAHDSAEARLEGDRIVLDYTQIKAPFSGLIIQRYVNFAEQVAADVPMFRISDFDPLLCPIQVPERDLPSLKKGQSAHVTVEPYPGERFEASVLRIRPVVDADTGTVRVTLQVRSRQRLRPGMFARVYVEVDRHESALVVPKAALSLESIGDTVYVADGATASRREVELGFNEGDFVEITSGLGENEAVVVVGQDGLSDGTPIQVLGPDAPPARGDAVAQGDPAPERSAGAGRKGAGAPGNRPPGRPPMDPANMTPEQLERAKELMRARGMTDQQIDQRLGRAGKRSEDHPAESRGQ